MVGKDRIRTPHALNIPFYSQVVNNISSFALKKVHQEFLKASRASDHPLGPCHCTLETSMGLPCAHIIRALITNNQKVRTNDFHQHWWIDGREIPQPPPAGDNQNPLQNVIQNLTERYATWPPHHAAATLNHMSEMIQESPVVLQNPLVPRTRGRPVGARNNVRSQSSTQRDLSAFELAEQGNNSRRCSVCRQIDHSTASSGRHQNPLQNVIQNLTERYATWPPHHAAATLNHMSEMIQESPVVLQNPLVPRTRGRPVGARNNVGLNHRHKEICPLLSWLSRGTTLGDAVYVVKLITVVGHASIV
ncbi:hypothetical protein BASA62_005787 [Batrachochytrium salamandrivorans]|nr:hypothetical protein BASA62_005787 [Batrachochytrium salamandrivorans]